MFAELLRAGLVGIAELSDAQIVALEAHYRLMVRWNRILNLTRISDEEEAIERHYVESLFLGAHLPSGRLHIADIGSGAGFPGFPVAVLRPDCDVTLIESHQRKAVFLREASRGLPNTRILAKRGEDVAESFDWAISRAVSCADLSRILPNVARSALLLTASSEASLAGFTRQSALALPGGSGFLLRFT